MTNRGKQPKVLSPKKVSRRKRTPRCDSCSKRDGDDAGGEGQAKVRLKLCARCRGVAYCGMECQKAGWKAHREVCVQYPSGADLPAPSPLVNHQKLSAAAAAAAGARSRRKVIYGGAVGPGGATPRQRENPPSRHPFFGRQEASERETRAAVGNFPSAKTQSARRLQQQQQQQQQEEERQEQKQQREAQAQPVPEDDASCPSPPTMQRLSFAGGAGRSRASSSSARGRSRRSSSAGSSTTPPGTKQSPSQQQQQQPRQGARGAVAAAVKKAASRVRRSTYTLPNGLRSRGSVSPRRPPPDDAGAKGLAPRPVRRESAPLYPVALEKSRRAGLGAAASGSAAAAAAAPRSGKRGPPPPYASVAYRADSIKKPSHSTSPGDKGWIKGGSASGATGRGRSPSTFGRVTDAAEESAAAAAARPAAPRRRASSGAGSPPPLPPRDPVHSGGSGGGGGGSPSAQTLLPAEPAGGTPTSFPQPSPEQEGGKRAEEEAEGEALSTAGRVAEGRLEPEQEEEATPPGHGGGEGFDGLRVSKDGEDERALEREREEEDTEEPTPERKDEDAQVQDAFGVPAEIVEQSPAEKAAEKAAEEAAAESGVRPGDETAPARPFLTKDAAADEGLSQDSAAGSPVADRKEAIARARSFLSSDSAESSSQDSAAGSTTVAAELEETAGQGRSFLSQESGGDSSQASAAGSTAGSTADRDYNGTTLRPALANDSGGSSSQDSAGGSSAEREKSAALGPPALAKGSAAGSSQDSAAGSATGREEGEFRAWPTEESGCAGWPTEDGACATWPTEDSAYRAWPTLRRSGSVQVSQDSAAASTVGEGGDQQGHADPAEASSATGRTMTLSEDSTARPTAGREDNALPSPLSMEPPAPIHSSIASLNGAGPGLSRAPSSGGAFDSCPPSAGAPSSSGPQRSMSVGTAPQYHSMPLVAAARGVAAAAAAAWNVNRRNSPRPRPPVSPGPAALSQSSPAKPSFRLRKHSAVDPDDEGAAAGAPSSTFSAAAAAAAAVGASFGGRKMSAPALSRTASARSFSTTASGRASPAMSASASPRSPPFVPAVELSPRRERPESPPPPGPRPTDTAVFYRERSEASADGVGAGTGLPPPSRAYLGRPEGFSVHVLVASAASATDLASRRQGGSEGGEHPPGGEGKNRRLYYSAGDRGRVASALQPGDVVLVTPGRYEAGAWGLQHLISSVEIIGAGEAAECVLYNKSASPSSSSSSSSSSHSGPVGDHYLVGVMGGALGSVGGVGGSVPEVQGKDSVEDDSDSGFEEGAFGVVAASSIASSGRRAVRVRLANLTLEQGSGYRGAVHQLGRESHLEMDGCTVLCSQGGVNVDQGTCVIRDSTISGSEAFGVHIGGEGAVEHCTIRDCGRGGGAGPGRRAGRAGAAAELSSSTFAEEVSDRGEDREEDDDGTDVNRVGGMPAISVLQSSRVRVRYNVVRENAGHALQCRDAPLPGGDGKYAVLARRAEAEAAEKLRSWLGSAAVLLREHLQEQHREGSIISEGNQCHRNRGCDAARCATMHQETEGAPGIGTSAACPAVAAAATGAGGDAGGAGRLGSGGGPVGWKGPVGGQACAPTAEEEGVPLPADMTLRFLAAMDEGYVGSRREENARLEKRRKEDGAG